ncbi:hypothetical protein D3C85_1644300 [compost metagenome]
MLRSSSSTSRGREKLLRMMASSALPICAPYISRATAPARVTARVLSSRERAIWPFLRASSRRLLVGSSLLSAPLSLSATQPP